MSTRSAFTEDLKTLYTVALLKGKLVIRRPRGEAELTPSAQPDIFDTEFPLTLRFTGDVGKASNGFAIDNGRVRNLRFEKVQIKPVGSR